jgi:uncharacterized protein
MDRADHTLTLVFAKAPIAGEVKTRLIPRLGAAGAAQLHEKLVRHTLTAVRGAALGDIALCCAPDCAHPFFPQCAGEFGALLQPQSTGNLGDRMHAAISQKLAGYARVLLVGTDCPGLDAEALSAAAAGLAPGTDLVFVPAEDGGYVVIGARRVTPAVFDGIDWGSAEVMQQTRDRLQALGWVWREQPALWDVDRPADLDRLRESGFAIVAPDSAAETA